MKVLYTAHATVEGGRDHGRARTPDGALDVELRTPPELGGEGGGTNPEQLFSAGYAACFEPALQTVARRRELTAGDARIESRVMLGPGDDRAFRLAVDLDVTLPGLDAGQAAELVAAAHRVCPYSNATRGNIDVTLSANGRPVEQRAPVA